MVTADVVLFTIEGQKLAVLLIKRKGKPFQGMWALPGGFIRMGEELGHAAYAN